MFDRQSVQVLGRVSVVMLFVGVGVGVASLLTWEWIEASVTSGSELSTIQTRVVNGYTPLAFLLITAITAPVVAGMLGILEGLRMESPRTTVFVGLGCLVGAALLVFVAGIFIGMTGPESGGDGPVGAAELVSLAGLSGIVSVLSGSLTALFGTQ